jgi:hypothetical protein
MATILAPNKGLIVTIVISQYNIGISRKRQAFTVAIVPTPPENRQIAISIDIFM